MNEKMIDLIKIVSDSPVPKYRQIINSIYDALDNKVVEKGHKMPSINELCRKYNLSRDTVITAFNELQSRGIITSQPGKGFYIAKPSADQQHHIFLLFDNFTPYKEDIYSAFREEIGRKGKVEIYFHHFNLKIFNNLIEDSIGDYTAYVIMPIPSKSVEPILELIPKDKLYILDRGRRLFGRKFPSVCQNFKEDVYNALRSGSDLIRKYRKLSMIFPEPSNIPRDIKRGFERYCKEIGIDYDIIKEFSTDKLVKNQAYLVFDDKSLVKLVQSAQALHYVPSRDIGIISYNDTPLKSVVATGITTISTDFAAMGKSMADLVLNRKKDHIINPCSLIRRNSI